MPEWRLAKSLKTLLEQVNDLAPNRDKSSDGTIGDQRHAASKSEHNPNENGVVRALDITHDPAGGVDSYGLAQSLADSRDQRILYIISNGNICSSKVQPWEWRPYTGSNKHDHHVHVSVVEALGKYDNVDPWVFKLNTLPGHPVVKIPSPHPKLQKGDSGEEVKLLQSKLAITQDGEFGPLTQKAVVKFQRANDLVPDGIVGHYTWEALL